MCHEWFWGLNTGIYETNYNFEIIPIRLSFSNKPPSYKPVLLKLPFCKPHHLSCRGKNPAKNLQLIIRKDSDPGTKRLDRQRLNLKPKVHNSRHHYPKYRWVIISCEKNLQRWKPATALISNRNITIFTKLGDFMLYEGFKRAF